jgi:hypothetical protein
MRFAESFLVACSLRLKAASSLTSFGAVPPDLECGSEFCSESQSPRRPSGKLNPNLLARYHRYELLYQLVPVRGRQHLSMKELCRKVLLCQLTSVAALSVS